MPFDSLRGTMLLSFLFFATGAPFYSHASYREDHPFITVASTTSLEDSGLFDHLLPVFTQKTGVDVYVAAVGTGQALKSGQLGECDVVFVHDPSLELQFMQNGFGSIRREVMYNDFVLVGPPDDPAKIDGTHDVTAAFRKIAEVKTLFVSRGDASGTDAEERRLWNEAGVHPVPQRDVWYVETGSSMEQTLVTAASRNGYALTDRSTWLIFEDHRNLKIVVEGDQRLINQYSVILVNPALHPQVKSDPGTAFIEWVTSRDGQDTIASYKVKSEQLFFPNYARP
jgi:tungstate transport system substrate-binding protein